MATGSGRITRRGWLGAVVLSTVAVGCNQLNRTLPSVEASSSTTPGAARTTQPRTSSSTSGAAAPSTSATFSAPSAPPASAGRSPAGAPSAKPDSTTSNGSGAGTDSGGREPVSVSFPGNNPQAVLQTIRVGQHDGFERVVFEFRDADAIPGVQVGYATQSITMDASGEPVAVAGDRVVVVRLQAASRFDPSQKPPRQAYSGPDRVPGNRAPVTETVFIGDFEARLSWAIGVLGNPRYTVATTVSPARVVVDLYGA